MKVADGESPEGTGAQRQNRGEDVEEAAGIPAKLLLTLFPFLLVLVFLLLEWWLRGRS